MAIESVKNEIEKLQNALQELGFDVEEVRIKPKTELAGSAGLDEIHFSAGMICRMDNGKLVCR